MDVVAFDGLFPWLQTGEKGNERVIDNMATMMETHDGVCVGKLLLIKRWSHS